MRLSLPASRDGGLEPGRSPLLPISGLLAVAVVLVVVDLRLGSRLALITAASAAASLVSRLPRALAITAALCLAVAAIAVLSGPGSQVTAVHAAARAHGHASRAK